MFYEPQTLIIVYKDEMVANQMKKMIETMDENVSAENVSRKNINVVAWTEKVWLANKKAGNINSKVLFLGSIKDVDKLIPVVDVKFDKHGVRYGWAGKQAVIYTAANEIKSIESYRVFHSELKTLPVPQVVRDAIKPKDVAETEVKSVDKTSNEVQPVRQENKTFFDKGKNIAKKLGHTIKDKFVDVSEWASVFSEENFRNRKAMERQMMFFGVINFYNDGLETFMKS